MLSEVQIELRELREINFYISVRYVMLSSIPLYIGSWIQMIIILKDMSYKMLDWQNKKEIKTLKVMKIKGWEVKKDKWVFTKIIHNSNWYRQEEEVTKAMEWVYLP